MKTTKDLIDEYNERLFAKLFPEKSDPIKCNFEINPNDEIFNLSFAEIAKQKLNETVRIIKIFNFNIMINLLF